MINLSAERWHTNISNAAVKDSENRIIALLSKDYVGIAARLIAAAPELLDVAEDFCDCACAACYCKEREDTIKRARAIFDRIFDYNPEVPQNGQEKLDSSKTN